MMPSESGDDNFQRIHNRIIRDLGEGDLRRQEILEALFSLIMDRLAESLTNPQDERHSQAKTITNAVVQGIESDNSEVQSQIINDAIIGLRKLGLEDSLFAPAELRHYWEEDIHYLDEGMDHLKQEILSKNPSDYTAEDLRLLEFIERYEQERKERAKRDLRQDDIGKFLDQVSPEERKEE